MMYSVDDLSVRLSDTSVKKYNNPYDEFDWPENITEKDWHFSEELISLYGTPVYEKLTEVQKKRLAFWECINFFSLNIHGEKSLLQGLTSRLYDNCSKEVSDYLHHFVDEENKHMSLFGNFCLRYAAKVYASKLLSLPREYAEGEENFLFFARVIIFEHIVDYYNVHMANHDAIHPFTRKINHYHHYDEGRHLAFGRAITRDLFEQYSPKWSDEVLAGIRQYLINYLQGNWREYYNPQVYADTGLEENGYTLYELAWHAEESVNRRKKASRSCIKFLLENNILLEEPAL